MGFTKPPWIVASSIPGAFTCRNPGFYPPILVCTPKQTNTTSSDKPKPMPTNTGQSSNRAAKRTLGLGGLFGLGPGVGPGFQILNRNGFAITRERSAGIPEKYYYSFGEPIPRYIITN